MTYGLRERSADARGGGLWGFCVGLVPAIKKKAEWGRRWIKSEESTFAERLVALASVKGSECLPFTFSFLTPPPPGSLAVWLTDDSHAHTLECVFESLLLWLVRRHLLAQEAGAVGWVDVLQRVDFEG